MARLPGEPWSHSWWAQNWLIGRCAHPIANPSVCGICSAIQGIFQPWISFPSRLRVHVRRSDLETHGNMASDWGKPVCAEKYPECVDTGRDYCTVHRPSFARGSLTKSWLTQSIGGHPCRPASCRSGKVSRGRRPGAARRHGRPKRRGVIVIVSPARWVLPGVS